MTSDIDLLRRAEQHAVDSEWSESLSCFEALLARRPGDPQILLQLSYVSSLAGKYRQAKSYTMAAADLHPRDAEVVHELIGRLRTFNEVSIIRKCLEQLRMHGDIATPTLIAFASQFSNLNLQIDALELLDEAINRSPEYSPGLISRAQVLIYFGRFEEAKADLERCARNAPQISRTWFLLALLGDSSSGPARVEAIRQELSRPKRSVQSISELAFALHKTLDDLGRFDEAWPALALGCRAKRQLLQYQSKDTVDLVDALIAWSPTKPSVPMAASNQSPLRTPIFIVGMHRSGTTLLENILHGHGDVHGLGELYDFTCQMRQATDHHCKGVLDLAIVERSRAACFSEIGRGYIDQLTWRLGSERFFIDKLPSNFFNIGFIMNSLPGARILHVCRDPMDLCFSNLRELFSDVNPFSYDQFELAQYYHQYDRLMKHWHRQFPGQILDVHYSDLTREPALTAKGVMDFCGLGVLPHSVLASQKPTRAISTASAVSARRSIDNSGVSKWLPYADQLRPLAEGLFNT